MHLLTLALFATLPMAAGSLPKGLEPVSRAHFRANVPHSNLEPSEDGRFIWFTEDSKDGWVLQRADAATGAITHIAVLKADFTNVAAIPTSPDRILLSQTAAWGSHAWRTVRFDLPIKTEFPYDTGSAGGDGRLEVSPSGRFFFTGIDYACHRGGGECFADTLAVYAIESRRRELSRRWPRVAKPFWKAGDLLNTGGAVLRRSASGAWVAAKASAKPSPQTADLFLRPASLFDSSSHDAEGVWRHELYVATSRRLVSAREDEIEVVRVRRADSGTKAGEGEAVRRWQEFRRVDARWRREARRPRPDEVVMDAARTELVGMLDALMPSDRDSLFAAELNESIGALWMDFPKRQYTWENPQRARPFLDAARAWWTAHPEAEERSERLRSLFRLSRGSLKFTNPDATLSVTELRLALDLAESDVERAQIHLELTFALRSTDPAVNAEFEAGLALGNTSFRQTLLWRWADHLRLCGCARPTRYSPECVPDPEAALAAYRMIRDEAIAAGTGTQDIDRVIAQIAGVDLRIFVYPNASGGSLWVSGRNLSNVEIALFRVPFPESFIPTKSESARSWVRAAEPAGTPIAVWTERLAAAPAPEIDRQISLPFLTPGVYVARVRAPGADEKRFAFAVSDLVLYYAAAAGHRTLFVTHRDGRAAPGVSVTEFVLGEAEPVPTRWRSDEHGRVELPDAGGIRSFLARDGDSVAALDTHFAAGETAELGLRALAEKMLYAPGEEAFVTVVANDRIGVRVPKAHIAAVAYEMVTGSAVATLGTVEFDQRGTGRIAWRVPDATRGLVRIRFPWPSSGSVRGSREIPLFRVVAPEGDSGLNVSVAARVVKGSDSGIDVAVQSNGAPVAGAKVKVGAVGRRFVPGQPRDPLDPLVQYVAPFDELTTDSDGLAKVEWKRSLFSDGCPWEYEIWARATAGRASGLGRARISVPTTIPPTTWALEGPQGAMRVSVRKERARPDEETPIEIASPETGRDVLLTITSATGVRSTVLPAVTGLTSASFRVPDDGSDVVLIGAAVVGAANVFPCSRTLSVEPGSRSLAIALTRSEDSVGVRVVAPDQKPVPATLVIWTVEGDEASTMSPLGELRRDPIYTARMTSLGGGENSIAPECARAEIEIFGNCLGIVTACEAATSTPPLWGLERETPPEARIPAVRSHTVVTALSGGVNVPLPRCVGCRLRILAVADGGRFGFLDEER